MHVAIAGDGGQSQPADEFEGSHGRDGNTKCCGNIVISRALVFARRIDTEHLSEILDMDPLAAGAAIEAFDEKDFSIGQRFELFRNSLECRLLHEFAFRHVHADRFSQSEIGIFVFRDTGKRCRRKLAIYEPCSSPSGIVRPPPLPMFLMTESFICTPASENRAFGLGRNRSSTRAIVSSVGTTRTAPGRSDPSATSRSKSFPARTLPAWCFSIASRSLSSGRRLAKNAGKALATGLGSLRNPPVAARKRD